MIGKGEREHPLPPPLQHVPTGIDGLDKILHGGFLSGGVYVVVGPPGTGKTVLANQICYNHVAAGGRAVFVSLLAESHARMFGHLQGQRYFDPDVVSHELLYVSAYPILEEHGLAGLLKALSEILTAQAATFLVIDGLLTADIIAPWQTDYQKFVQGLQGVCDLMGATALLLSKDPQDSSRSHSQHTMVDGIVELEDIEVGPAVIRELNVRKFRGSGYLRGKHIFRITDEGLVVYPRTETLYKIQAPPRTYTEKVKFGIEGLDAALHGGVQRGSTTMLLGAPGSGKTLSGLHFLAQGAAEGEHGLYMGFYESPARVIATAEGVGLPFTQFTEKGLITTLWHLPVEVYLDEIGGCLIEAVQAHQIKRVFLDGLSALNNTLVYPLRMPIFMTTLINFLRDTGVTTVFTMETHAIMAPTIEVPLEGISVLAENLILLGHVEYASNLERQITILKVRQHNFDKAIRRVSIDKHGLHVGDPFLGAHGVLTGQARMDDNQQIQNYPAPQAYEDNPGH